MVSILLLEEEYIYRKDALDLKPKVALSQILSPQLVHEPLCHIGSSRNNRHPWALMTQKIYNFFLSKSTSFLRTVSQVILPQEWFNQTELQTKECSKRSENPRRLTVSKH